MRFLLLLLALAWPAQAARAETPPRNSPACSAGAERDPERIREFLWRLAGLERLLGYETMLKAYATVDICEHAITTDGEADMAYYRPPLPTDPAPYDKIVDSGGVFLPDGVRYNETICAGPDIGEVDMRWFLHGYLSRGLSGAAKPVVGKVYDFVLYRLRGDAAAKKNADTNERSLGMGRALKAGGKGLEQFARTVLFSLGLKTVPPQDKAYLRWQAYRPVTAEQVRAALRARVPQYASAVEVRQVNKGLFILSGNVPDRKARALVHKAAADAAGSKAVDNQLSDRPAAAPGGPAAQSFEPAPSVDRTGHVNQN